MTDSSRKLIEVAPKEKLNSAKQFELQGSMYFTRLKRNHMDVNGYLFEVKDLRAFGYPIRAGHPIHVMAVRSGKGSVVKIVSRVEFDLRTASDMRLKPAWRKLPWLEPAIEAIYAERDRISCETKIPFEVDHVLPITGVNPPSCGLTVPWNLQIISATENRRKSNKITI